MTPLTEGHNHGYYLITKGTTYSNRNSIKAMMIKTNLGQVYENSKKETTKIPN